MEKEKEVRKHEYMQHLIDSGRVKKVSKNSNEKANGNKK